jgi:hypothetical protein
MVIAKTYFPFGAAQREHAASFRIMQKMKMSAFERTAVTDIASGLGGGEAVSLSPTAQGAYELGGVQGLVFPRSDLVLHSRRKNQGLLFIKRSRDPTYYLVVILAFSFTSFIGREHQNKGKDQEVTRTVASQD